MMQLRQGASSEGAAKIIGYCEKKLCSYHFPSLIMELYGVERLRVYEDTTQA